MTDYEFELNPLGTANFPGFKDWMGVPIGTAVGRAKWMPGIDQIEELKPFGLIRGFTQFEFRLKYMERLDRNEDKIHARLVTLSQKYPGQRLVLLCWEDLRRGDKWCHRELVAEWLEARGISCPEMTTGAVATPDQKTFEKAEPKKDAWTPEPLF